MTIDTKKLRELIAGVHRATEAHGEAAWYGTDGVIYIDPDGIAKADADYIAYLSPEHITAILDELDAQAAEIERLQQMLPLSWRPIETAPRDGSTILLHAARNALAQEQGESNAQG